MEHAMTESKCLIDRDGVDQGPDQIIDIADWPMYGDYEVYPVGARDKSLLISPDPAPHTFCLPGHRYLFKEAIKSVKNPGQPRHPEGRGHRPRPLGGLREGRAGGQPEPADAGRRRQHRGRHLHGHLHALTVRRVLLSGASSSAPSRNARSLTPIRRSSRSAGPPPDGRRAAAAGPAAAPAPLYRKRKQLQIVDQSPKLEESKEDRIQISPKLAPALRSIANGKTSDYRGVMKNGRIVYGTDTPSQRGEKYVGLKLGLYDCLIVPYEKLKTIYK